MLHLFVVYSTLLANGISIGHSTESHAAAPTRKGVARHPAVTHRLLHTLQGSLPVKTREIRLKTSEATTTSTPAAFVACRLRTTRINWADRSDLPCMGSVLHIRLDEQLCHSKSFLLLSLACNDTSISKSLHLNSNK